MINDPSKGLTAVDGGAGQLEVGMSAPPILDGGSPVTILNTDISTLLTTEWGKLRTLARLATTVADDRMNALWTA